MPKGQLCRVPWPGNSGCHSLASLLFERFSSPTNIHIPLSCSHWTSTSLHSICFINSFCFFLKFYLSSRGFLQSTACMATSKRCKATWKDRRPHQVTCPPCGFWLLSWEKVNRAMNLINSMRLPSLINYSWEKWHHFVDTGSSTLTVLIKLALHTWVMMALNPGLIMLPSPLLF